MFKNMFEKYKKNKKGQKWHMPDKKVQQYCYIPYKYLLNEKLTPLRNKPPRLDTGQTYCRTYFTPLKKQSSAFQI